MYLQWLPVAILAILSGYELRPIILHSGSEIEQSLNLEDLSHELS